MDAERGLKLADNCLTTMSHAFAPALPGGFRLGEYFIIRTLGGGGFGLVYKARDADGQEYAIKEYLPAALATRAADAGTVVLAPQAQQTVFQHGMKCFFEEGRALAAIRHPNVVRVVNFFRANDTVYMAMRFERGATLQQHIAAARGGLREDFLRRVFFHALTGLRAVHTRRLLHLDIKPANLMVREDGSPVLMDFGAARQTLSADSTRLAPMYTPGFAAPEQTGARDRLGPWTDVYGVGATLYACLAGEAPPAAETRVVHDRLVPASVRFARNCSAPFLALIDACLAPDLMARPQSVYDVQKALRGDAA